MRSCPACRRSWPDDREVCPTCLAHLVDELDALIVCGHCGTECPARMQSCTSCFALLRVGDVDHTSALARTLETGKPMQRPPGIPAFAGGPGCTVRRLVAGGPLVLVGPDGFVEASLEGSGPRVTLPLTCSTDTGVLFALERYEAADRAVVAVERDGSAVATFLRSGTVVDPRINVRDETSAPVAVVRRHGATMAVMETGRDTVLAAVHRADIERAGWLDDEWTVTPTPAGASGRPLTELAVVALAAAVKVLLGRPAAVAIAEDDADVDDPWDLRS